MKVLIRQQSGLGDIFYLQKVIYKLNEKYAPEQIIWPLDDLYTYVKDYFQVPDNVYFVNDKENFEYKDVYNSSIKEVKIIDDKLIYIPFQFSHEKKYGGSLKHIMKSKYEFVSLDGSDWYNYIKLNRNHKKEKELFQQVVQSSEPYIVVNNTYGPITNAKVRKDMAPATPYKIIQMSSYDGYTPFDWSLIFENAKEIHTVETSIPYLLQVLNLNNVYLYYRILTSDEIKYNSNHPWFNFDYCRHIHSNTAWKFEQI